MHRLFVPLWLVLFVAVVPATAQERPADHVILVSIDGLRPEFYQDTSWPAPVLQQLARDGAQADAVRPVFPSVTYPDHTTIVTGALPARHGIYYNSPFEPEGQTGRWYWEADSIRVPTLWDAVRDAGLESASIMWPVSVGAPITYNVPEVWPLERYADQLGAIRAAETPAGLVAEIEREATGRLAGGDLSSDYLAREARFAEAAAYLIETYRPALLTLHLIGADHFQHDEGRSGDYVDRAVAAVDYAVGQLQEAADRAGIADRTAIVVTGDHGFIDIHSRLAPNVWLVEAGLMEAARDRGDWRATFHTSGAAAFLHLRDPSDTAAVDEVRQILDALPAAQRDLLRILDREDLAAIGADPRVPLALAPIPGVNMSSTTRGPALQAADGGTHGFFPDDPRIMTGFLAYGAGVRTGVTVPQMGLQDVAPFVAALLGLDFDAPDGVLFPGLLAE